jgi:hypothetical protein
MEGMEKKDGKFQMRNDPEFGRMLDDWRRRQPDIPSRAEAIRTLVRKGIEADLPPQTNEPA